MWLRTKVAQRTLNTRFRNWEVHLLLYLTHQERESIQGMKHVFHQGPALAPAVSSRLPIAMTRVRARVRSCRICGGQSCTEAGYLRVLRFPLPIFMPRIAPQSSSSIIWGWYNRPNSGRSTKWTQSVSRHEKKTFPQTPCLVTKHVTTQYPWLGAENGSNKLQWKACFSQ
jgi:hypothetical protein